MEQFNTSLPDKAEENKPAAVGAYDLKQSSPLLEKVRQNFGFFGGVSLIFGVLLALLFYKAGIGLNTLLFTSAIVIFMNIIMNKLSVPIKKETVFYYTGVVLLGLSCTLTASGILQFINILGILLLLDLSLLHQFYEDKNWDFVGHFMRMLGLFFLSVAAIGKPFTHCVGFLKKTRMFKNDKVRNIFMGCVISIPFLCIILMLLANADLLFKKLTYDITGMLFSTDLFIIILISVFGFFICYCIICAAVSKPGTEAERSFKKAEASIAATFMTLLCLVYTFFCGIQLVYLFANGLFVLPEEYTFAEYARRGFFELLTVAVINVLLMVLCRAFFKESKILRFVITFMTICTYIMIASAAYRMYLYISAYHLTFLRVFVLLSLFVIALILAGVIIAEYRQSFPIFKYCVAITAVCYIAFSFTKPDYFIAKYLVENKVILDGEDIWYLTDELSMDAAPVVLEVLTERSRWSPEALSGGNKYGKKLYLTKNVSQDYYIDKYMERIEEEKPDIDLRDFNYSKYLASKELVKKTKYLQ